MTANDAELNHTRRRLSVLSDNKLVDGVDSLNLDGKGVADEAPPSASSVPVRGRCVRGSLLLLLVVVVVSDPLASRPLLSCRCLSRGSRRRRAGSS